MTIDPGPDVSVLDLKIPPAPPTRIERYRARVGAVTGRISCAPPNLYQVSTAEGFGQTFDGWCAERGIPNDWTGMAPRDKELWACFHDRREPSPETLARFVRDMTPQVSIREPQRGYATTTVTAS